MKHPLPKGRGFYAVPATERTRRGLRGLLASRRILMATLVSLSSSVPHAQECQRRDSSFLRTVPHPEQTCEVDFGFTNRTVRPAHSALGDVLPSILVGFLAFLQRGIVELTAMGECPEELLLLLLGRIEAILKRFSHAASLLSVRQGSTAMPTRLLH